jgi:hypothetical protein
MVSDPTALAPTRRGGDGGIRSRGGDDVDGDFWAGPLLFWFSGPAWVEIPDEGSMRLFNFHRLVQQWTEGQDHRKKINRTNDVLLMTWLHQVAANSIKWPLVGYLYIVRVDYRHWWGNYATLSIHHLFVWKIVNIYKLLYKNRILGK